MTPDDSVPFLARLNALGEIFDAKFSEAKQALYFGALEDLELETVIRGLNLAARECKFMPRPAEIRALVCGDSEDDAELAWLEYKRLALKVGGYGSPTMDAALAGAIEGVFGTWEQACWTDLTPEMWASKRKEFGRVYRVLKNRAVQGVRELPGFIDRDHALRGYDTQKALTEGDETA